MRIAKVEPSSRGVAAFPTFGAVPPDEGQTEPRSLGRPRRSSWTNSVGGAASGENFAKAASLSYMMCDAGRLVYLSRSISHLKWLVLMRSRPSHG